MTEDTHPERTFVGRLPLSAVTPEMLKDPKLMLASPFFITREEMESWPVTEDSDDDGDFYDED